MEWRKLLSSSRRKDKEKKGKTDSANPKKEWRQEIERDFDRILFATPTRRLADKTQVFPLDANDSVRTRLTHSHEVANFARGIGMRLAFEKSYLFNDLQDMCCIQRDVPALLAAIGLAHDLGNPPFGHQGEASMRNWYKRCLKPCLKEDLIPLADEHIFEDFFQFDGNSQTLRLVTKLQILNDQYGLNLTYATLSSLIKYPRSSHPTTGSRWKKHGFFYSERSVVDDIWQQTGLSEGNRHPFTWLMEACDDIAYSILDAEDTVKKGLASYHDLINHLNHWSSPIDSLVKQVIDETQSKNNEYEQMRQALSPAELNDMSMQMFRVKSSIALVDSVVDAYEELHADLLKGDCKFTDLIGQSRGKALCEALKDFDRTRGYRHRSVLELELKGSNYIQGLMDMLWVGIHGHKTKEQREKEKLLSQPARSDYLSETPFGRYAYGRISENYRRVFEDADNTLPVLYKEAQLLSDAISGMTDSYLMKLHDELKSLYEYESCNKPSAS
jgi:dGTPase